MIQTIKLKDTKLSVPETCEECVFCYAEEITNEWGELTYQWELWCGLKAERIGDSTEEGYDEKKLEDCPIVSITTE